MFWRQWRAPKKPNISRPALPGLRKQVNGKKLKYSCIDGPLKGSMLMLSDGNTAIFSIGGEHGRYECAIVATDRLPGETKWRPR